jgi:hypothetical protein
MKTTELRLARVGLSFLVFLLAAVLPLACGSGDDDDSDDDADDDDAGDDDTGDACPEPTLDIAVCALDAGPFTSEGDNDFFPLVVGAKLVLEGEDDEGVLVRVEISTLDETENVGGVTTRVVEERESEDGEIVEISRNWIAQAPDGTVCYFGEDVDIYEDGEVTGHSGAWRAGENDALAGILMPGDPQVGDAFYQEFAVGVAEDMSEVTDFGEAISVPAGDFDDTLTAEDCNPLEGGTDRKVYVRGIGLAIDEDAELVEYE